MSKYPIFLLSFCDTIWVRAAFSSRAPNSPCLSFRISRFLDSACLAHPCIAHCTLTRVSVTICSFRGAWPPSMHVPLSHASVPPCKTLLSLNSRDRPQPLRAVVSCDLVNPDPHSSSTSSSIANPRRLKLYEWAITKTLYRTAPHRTGVK